MLRPVEHISRAFTAAGLSNAAGGVAAVVVGHEAVARPLDDRQELEGEGQEPPAVLRVPGKVLLHVHLRMEAIPGGLFMPRRIVRSYRIA